MKDVFSNILGILKLDKKTILSVAKNKKATGISVGIMAIIGAITYPIQVKMNPEAFAESGMIALYQNPIYALIAAVASLFIISGIIHLAAKVLGGKGKYLHLVRVSGHASPLSILNIVPIVGQIIATIWGLCVTFTYIKEIHKLSTGKTIFAMILPALALIVVLVVFFILLGVGLSASGGAGQL